MTSAVPNDYEALLQARSQVAKLWGGAAQGFPEMERLHLEMRAAVRVVEFARLLDLVRSLAPMQGWVMQPSAVSVFTASDALIATDAPWLAAELLLNDDESMSIRHDGRAFVCTRLRERRDDTAAGSCDCLEVIAWEAAHRLTDAPIAPRQCTHIRYRVFSAYDHALGWRPMASRFLGFGNGRGGQA